jgi:hypothetical protein
MVTAFQVLIACIYGKVKLTKTEKRLIPYWPQKTFSIFKYNNITDTVYFRKSGRSYVPNFDHWWGKKVWSDTSTKRGFYHTIIAGSNFPHNKYTDKHLHLFLRISFAKKWDNDTLRLTIDDFDQTYNLCEYTSDTLVFERPKNKPCGECLTKILWALDRGIIQIDKNDATVWEILTKRLNEN